MSLQSLLQPETISYVHFVSHELDVICLLYLVPYTTLYESKDRHFSAAKIVSVRNSTLSFS